MGITTASVTAGQDQRNCALLHDSRQAGGERSGCPGELTTERGAWTLIAGETDIDLLARLRRDPECPGAVLLLAEQAARKTRLVEANERAEAVSWDDAIGNESTGALHSEWAQDSDSQMRSLSRAYYSRLGMELEKVLGLPLTGRAIR